ncbi:hypothetical protein GGR02_000846 [Anoxybacillus voinovskiensis]|uniref:DUF309 domain-containing protein n=1 Tax=Anoxybacteroides voinovskiense TaxID=230470 RepID=A0A840DN78_9BACL|nr:hypothetical protein [Anoxybacillus voinovskiensis]GGJ59610.1 hypothetical protein GCM10008982_05820 [Anoxybacillus voinovskiensis]
MNTLYPSAYLEYLYHFHTDRDYFECHELLEEHWKQDGKKHVWALLIQIAVALYHHRRGNASGAKRMMQKANGLLAQEKDAVRRLGLDEEELARLLKQYIKQIDEGKPYESISLPINDETLLQTCLSLCKQKGGVWGQKSDMANEFLLHKHMLRDRSDVIAARAAKKKRLPS